MKKYFFLLAALLISLTGTVEAVPGKVPPPDRKLPPPGTWHSPDKFRRAHGVWRAFSRLSQEEKRELLKLQRTDPDKFRAELHKKADELYQRERERRAKLNALGARYRAETDPAKKAQIKAELRKMIRQNMENNLAHMRRNIEESKQNIIRMEKSLKKRESKVEAITDSITERILSGKPKPHRSPRAAAPAKL